MTEHLRLSRLFGQIRLSYVETLSFVAWVPYNSFNNLRLIPIQKSHDHGKRYTKLPSIRLNGIQMWSQSHFQASKLHSLVSSTFPYALITSKARVKKKKNEHWPIKFGSLHINEKIGKSLWTRFNWLTLCGAGKLKNLCIINNMNKLFRVQKNR